jgi:hypothetical protein
VAFEISASTTRDRVIEVGDVRVGTDFALLCLSSPITSPMPAIAPPSVEYTQKIRHWVVGMRVRVNVPFVLDK